MAGSWPRRRQRCGPHRFRGALVATAVNDCAEHEHHEAGGLDGGELCPALAEAGADVEEQQADEPDEEGAHRLEDGAEDGAEVAGDVHAHVVVREQPEHLHEEHDGEVAAAADHVQRVKDVLVDTLALLSYTHTHLFTKYLFPSRNARIWLK